MKKKKNDDGKSASIRTKSEHECIFCKTKNRIPIFILHTTTSNNAKVEISMRDTITVVVDEPNEPSIRVETPINFCPMCGRKLNEYNA